jgi:hypothetical protein
MNPAPRDLELYRRDDYTHVLTFTDNANPPGAMPLTGYTFKAEIRDRQNGGQLLATFDVDTSQAAQGIITISLPGSAVQWPDEAFWDLQVTAPGGSMQTWLAGAITLSGDVTK